jgi:hypothetical protein
VNRAAVTSLIFIVGIGSGGCSAVFLPSPSAPKSPTARIDCKTSSPLPVLDMVAGAAAIIAAAQVEERNHQSDRATALFWGGALVIGSGIWGNRKVIDCEALLAQQEKRKQQTERYLVFAPPPAPAPAPDAAAPPTAGDAPAPATLDPWLQFGAPPEALGVSLLAPPPDGGAADAEAPR